MDDSGGEHPYERVNNLTWQAAEEETGKIVKLRGFPKDYKVKLLVGCGVYPPHGLCHH